MEDDKSKKEAVDKSVSRMFCWGSTSLGQLGTGGTTDVIPLPTPHKFKASSRIVQVVCGVTHSIIITKSGELYSCGKNDHGQLGHTKSKLWPHKVEGLEANKMIQAACGGQHTLAFNDWGQLFGWGSDSLGQLGMNGESQPYPKIIRSLAMHEFVQVCCGLNHSLGLTNGGQIFSWGCNAYGQLGLGNEVTSQKSPELVKALVGIPIAFIASGSNHTFALSKSGAIYGWGKNNVGQLGLNDEEDKSFPTQLKTLRSIKVKYIACGDEYSAFLTADGGVFTCGSGKYGQLGHGSKCNEILPRKVTELMGNTVTQVSCGSHHTVAFVPSKGRLYAFGLGLSGQLGIKYLINATTPQIVLGPWVNPSNNPGYVGLDGSENIVVKNIFCGGNHNFAMVVPWEPALTFDDCRIYKKETQILYIDPERISECQKLQVNSRVDQDLFLYLETVFGSQSCLNSSFLLANEEHYCCSPKHHGVDMNLAESIFRDIARIENTACSDIIWDGIVDSLIPSLSPNPLDIEILRTYLILPMYHEFENPRNSKKLQEAFAKKFLDLNAESLKIIELWWSKTSFEYFERLVRIYKDVVAYHLRGAKPEQEVPGGGPAYNNVYRYFFPDAFKNKFNVESVKIALEILAFLNKVNRSVEDLKVPYDTFYLPELTDAIDIRTDYIRWISDSPHSANRLFFCNYSFLFDARAKTSLLQADQSIQMQTAMSQAASRLIAQMLFAPTAGLAEEQFLVLNVTRENVVQNTLDQLSNYDSSDLKKPLRVKFIGEEAEDAGGVRKEFFMLVLREVLDPKYGMFKHYEETRTIWFSEVSFEDELMYFLIGLLCGLAIYNFTIIDLPFPLALYKKLLQEKVGLMDLKGLSPCLAKSLQDILDYDEPNFEEVFCLTFEASRDVFGEVTTTPLKEGGDKIEVKQENKVEFVNMYVDFILNKSIKNHFLAFHEGFHKVCGGRVLDLFHSHELMTLIVGNENYDWEEFERNAVYKNGYSRTDRTIQMFWEVFHDLPLEEKRNFLLFLTGSDRIPIQGMKAIKILIQPTPDERYLPVAHTCFNLLDLPRYATKERLKYKLCQAIKQNQGFSLV